MRRSRPTARGAAGGSRAPPCPPAGSTRRARSAAPRPAGSVSSSDRKSFSTPGSNPLSRPSVIASSRRGPRASGWRSQRVVQDLDRPRAKALLEETARRPLGVLRRLRGRRQRGEVRLAGSGGSATTAGAAGEGASGARRPGRRVVDRPPDEEGVGGARELRARGAAGRAGPRGRRTASTGRAPRARPARAAPPRSRRAQGDTRRSRRSGGPSARSSRSASGNWRVPRRSSRWRVEVERRGRPGAAAPSARAAAPRSSSAAPRARCAPTCAATPCREVPGAQVPEVDEGVAEGPPGRLGLAHRRPELALRDLARPEEARPEPVLLDRRGGEGDRAVHEVEALGDLALGQGEDARPALGPDADDLLGDERLREVDGRSRAALLHVAHGLELLARLRG